MLDKRAFLRELGMLAERFGRAISEPVMLRYYDTLSSTLTTAEFVAAARVVFDTDTFWPPPARFIELAHGNARDDGEREWARLLDACARGDRNHLPSAEGAAAMRAVGGWNAVAYCEGDHNLDRKRVGFLRAFAAAREEREYQNRALPAGAALELEAL